MISRSLSSSQKYAALYRYAAQHKGDRRLAEFWQALYPLLVVHSDDFGRQQGDAFTVKLEVLPISPRKEPDFETALEALNDVGLIRWYEVSGRMYIQISDFDEHQVGLHKRTKSKFPEPPRNSRKFREFPSQEKRTELNRTEGKGREPRVLDRSRDAWTRLVDELRGVISEQSLEMWLRPCSLLEEHEDKLVVAVPTAFVHEWLSKHYVTTLQEAAEKVLAGKHIQFVLMARAVS